MSISDRMSQGVYVSDVVDVCRQFKFMLAGRYDYYKYRSTTVQLKDGDRNYEKPASDAYKSIVNNALSYRVGAVYEPTEALSLFASMGSFSNPTTPSTQTITSILTKTVNAIIPKMVARCLPLKRDGNLKSG